VKVKEKEEDGEEGDDEAPAGKSVPELFLANKWDLDAGLDPTGWWISEKLEGVRRSFINIK
jgi:DNA ligase-1